MSFKHTSLAFLLFTGLIALSTSTPAANEASTEPELERAIALYRAEGAEKALSEFERLHVLFEQNGERNNEAIAERYIGECH